MYYEDVFCELNRKKVRYLVIGGVALVLHGVVRLTADLDLMLDMGPTNLSKFVAAVERIGYKPKVPVKSEDFADPDRRREWKLKKRWRFFHFFTPKSPFKQ